MTDNQRAIDAAVAELTVIKHSTKPADQTRKVKLRKIILALGGEVPPRGVSPPIGFVF